MATPRLASSVGRAATSLKRAIPATTSLEASAARRASLLSTVKEPSSQGVPAVLMRAGTSKGVYLHKDHMPTSQESWPTIISAIMGSHNGDKRQLDGVGGATSTTSKAAIISASSHPEADVDYTFAQVGVGVDKVDMSGSCGNICSGVGAFALDERLVEAEPGSEQTTVRVHDTNTGAIIEQTIAVDEYGFHDPNGDHRISGYAGTGSPLKMAWLKPAGTVGPREFLPTGNSSDMIEVDDTDFGRFTARASMIDAANPFVFVDAVSLPQELLAKERDDPQFLDALEKIRCEASVRMGISSSTEEAHKTRPIPKIALLYQPEETTSEQKPDIRIEPFSMGKPHPSCQLTGTIALSAALSYPGTTASDLARQARGLPPLTEPEVGALPKVIAHPSGINKAEVVNSVGEDNKVEVEKVSILTTAERVFRGEAYVRLPKANKL